MSDLKVDIRWLIRRDMREVLCIEDESYEFAWSEVDFLNALRQRNCIGMVAEYKHQVVGFMIYELHRHMIEVLKFAVDPEFRHRGIGHQLARRVIDKLTQQHRREVLITVRESNLPALLFLRKSGFRAESILQNHFWECEEDGYVMSYKLERRDSDFPHDLIPINRMSKYLQGGA